MPREGPDDLAPGAPPRAARHLSGSRERARDLPPARARRDGGRADAGPALLQRAGPGGARARQLLGLQHDQLLRAGRALRRGRGSGGRVQDHGARPPPARPRGDSRRRLQPQWGRGRARTDALLARPRQRGLLPARPARSEPLPRRHGLRQHAEPGAPADAAPRRREPALLGRADARRRLPLRPGAGARPWTARRRVLARALRGPRRGSDAVAGQADRRALGPGRRRLPPRGLPGGLRRVERSIPRLRAPLLARRARPARRARDTPRGQRRPLRPPGPYAPGEPELRRLPRRAHAARSHARRGRPRRRRRRPGPQPARDPRLLAGRPHAPAGRRDGSQPVRRRQRLRPRRPRRLGLLGSRPRRARPARARAAVPDASPLVGSLPAQRALPRRDGRRRAKGRELAAPRGRRDAGAGLGRARSPGARHVGLRTRAGRKPGPALAGEPAAPQRVRAGRGVPPAAGRGPARLARAPRHRRGQPRRARGDRGRDRARAALRLPAAASGSGTRLGMSERPWLDALAERCGVERSYLDHDGQERTTPDATREALLAALRLDASSEERAESALRGLEATALQPGLEPVRVIRAGSPELACVELRVPPGTRGKLAWRLEVRIEGTGVHDAEGEAVVEGSVVALPMPASSELCLGYHALRCEVDRFALSEAASTQDLIVVPASCLPVSALIGERRAVGVWEHLYALHSQGSWGVGDLGDLCRLIDWAARLGLDFVGINPLHATDPFAPEVSPYHPLSRLYRNPIYLDVERAFARLGDDGASASHGGAEPDTLRPELPASSRVDYRLAYAAKRRALEMAHERFVRLHRDRGSELGRAYAEYCGLEGPELLDWATFCALREELSARDPRHADWRSWPEEYRDPRGASVAAFAAERAPQVDLHAYLQFELEGQLQSCQQTARGMGMPIGLYGDLALGDAPDSGDVWARSGLYARGVGLGAPPDAYSDAGQAWGLVPFDPLRLRADRDRHWSLLLRQTVRHRGMLRIDHVMALGRQFWVPAGAPARAGGYLRQPLAELLGILALESRRAGALVVGEDLGLVAEGFREQMAEHNLLRSLVLYFERDGQGEFVEPRRGARAALVSVGTHDLPPLAGWWTGRDLRVRRRAGNLASDEAQAQASAQREEAKSRLAALLRREGLLPAGFEEPGLEALREAVHLLLADSAGRLVAVALDDLVGEEEALNTPAARCVEAPNWSRRSKLSLEELAASEGIRDLVRRVLERAGSTR